MPNENRPRVIVAGWVEHLFGETSVALPTGGSPFKAYRCNACNTVFVAEDREKVPAHECEGLSAR